MMAVNVSTHITDQVVQSGACIGCGLCAGISDGAIEMAFTPEMQERPVVRNPIDKATENAIRATCPGLKVEGIGKEEAHNGAEWHPVWGYVKHGAIAWAKDETIRHNASTGGALSALGAFLVSSGEVDFILHVGPHPDYPARSRWKISKTAAEAADSGGSRYGPAAPLAGLGEAKREIEAGAKRFAFIAKPCDISAIRLLAKREKWLQDSLAYTLTLMCGGASAFSKTLNLLSGWSIEEDELQTLRYRGFGNPGPTTAETKDGRAFSTTYNELWDDESTWAVQHRCKICADAIGIAADLVAFDCWPGGGPEGEDEGFNAVITRTAKGHSLYKRALASGILETSKALSPKDYLDFQPHHERKRKTVWARLTGQSAAGEIAPETHNLGVRELAFENGFTNNLAEARGTRMRLKNGKGKEALPTKQED